MIPHAFNTVKVQTKASNKSWMGVPSGDAGARSQEGRGEQWTLQKWVGACVDKSEPRPSTLPSFPTREINPQSDITFALGAEGNFSTLETPPGLQESEHLRGRCLH